MTAQEFNKQLWPYLTARYLQVAHWLGLLPSVARHERDTTQSDVLAAWQGIFADIALNDAREAIDSLVKSDPPKEFKNLSDFPTAIRAEARRLSGVRSRSQSDSRPSLVNGEVTYRCRMCQDVGMVTVWHPAAHEAARKIPTEFVERGRDAYTCAVACTCETGRIRNSPNAVRFNADKMVRPMAWSREGRKEGRRELVEILAVRDEGRTQRYDFD